MKKRFISVLLTLCMVLAMIPCLTITASAADTITYTLKAGDTVLKVCQANGINFYANMEWIKRANNITDFTKLPVGKVLTLPAAGTTPSLNDLPGSSSGSSTGSTSAGSTGGTTTGSTGGVANGTLLDGDYVQEYLIYHVMVSGDTVGALCNRYGVDFASNADRIMKLNNIKSWNRIAVGKTLLLPCASLPSSGNCIRVIAHRVVRGDTAIGVCNSYGVAYASVMSLMQALNNRTNLNAIQVGQTLLVPVPSVITNGQAGGTTTPGGSTGNTGDSGNTSSGTKYTVNKNSVNSNYGSYAISSLSATAGTTITVRVSPKTNYALGSVSVRNDSDGSSIAVTYNGNDATFKMPESNVTVSVNFVASTQYTISRDGTTNGTFATHVNGKAVDKAMAGQTVQIVATPAANYEIDKITYVYNGKTYSADANDSFVMPEGNVLVKVSFKRMAEYAITAVDKDNADANGGTYTVTRNGSTVTKALSGDTIKINPVPKAGYSVSGVKVVGTDNGVTVPVTESSGVYSFVMPRYAVTITVSFDNRSYSITTNVGANGGYTVTVKDSGESQTKATAQARNGQSVVSANSGDKVSLAITHNDGYKVDTVVVTQADGSIVPNLTGSDDAWSFTMPASNVTVKVTFTTSPYKVTAKLYGTGNDYNVTVGGNTVAATSGGAEIGANLGATVTITLNDKPWKDGYKISSVMLKKTQGETAIDVLVQINSDGRSATFNMPAYNVTVEVACDAKPLTITTNIAGTGGGYTVKVGGNDAVKASNSGTVKATVGQQIVIGAVDQKAGYGVIKTEFKTASGKDVVRDDNWNFKMPAEDVIITVTFGPLFYTASFKGNASSDAFNVKVGSDEAKKVEGTGGEEIAVKTDDKVTISGLMADQGGVIDKVVVSGVKDPYVSSGNTNSVTFNMPAKGEAPVTVTVSFKEKT